MRYVENLTSVEGGYGRTGSRSPMQWDDSANAGFTDTSCQKLYIPLDPDPKRPNVKDQLSDSDSLLGEVQKLIRIRKEHQAFGNSGGIEFICDGGKGKPLAYYRRSGEERILVAVNPTDKDFVLPVNDSVSDLIYCLGEKPGSGEGKCMVKARSAFFAAV